MWEAVENLTWNCLSLGVLACLAVASFGLGRCLQRLLKLQIDDFAETIVWGVALGLLCAGAILTILGFYGWLDVPMIAVITAAAAIVGIAELGQIALRHLETQALAPPPPAESIWLRRALIAVVAVVLPATLLAALAPPTAGDALCYHLELPKEFLRQHRIAFLPFSDNSTFPLLGEMLYLWPLALGGPVAAQLMAWGTGVLLAGATLLLARPLVGPQWAPVAAAIVLLVPGVTSHMAAPLSDLAVALWITLTLCAWQNWFNEQQTRPWLIVTGLMLGAALSTKYVALLFVVAFAGVWLFRWLRDRTTWELLPRAFFAALIIAMVLASPWYLRAAYYRGDPVFPFFTQALGLSDTAPRTVDKTPLERSALGAIKAPWQITMDPENFGGRSHQLGPLFLLLLPGLMFCRRLRGLNTLLSIAGVYAVLWFFMRQNVRFLYPVLPILAIGVTWGLMELRRLPIAPRRIAGTAVTAALLACLALPVYRVRDRLAVATGFESRSNYLQRLEPSFQAATIVNQLAGSRARILSQDYRGFYFRGQFTRESIFRRLTRYDQHIHDSRELSRHLKEHGFTHLVLAESPDSPVEQDERLARLVDAELAAQAEQHDLPLLPLASYPATDPDGVRWRYRLFELR